MNTNIENNIYECIAFNEPAYCCMSKSCEGCPRYENKKKVDEHNKYQKVRQEIENEIAKRKQEDIYEVILYVDELIEPYVSIEIVGLSKTIKYIQYNYDNVIEVLTPDGFLVNPCEILKQNI